MNSIRNQKGFISLYAILIFMILLVFVTMCTYQLRVHAMIRQSQELHFTEVFILQHVRHKVMNDSKEDTHEELTTEETQAQTITEEIVQFQQTDITIQYEEKKILAIYFLQERSYRMDIQLDEENHILAVAYS